MTSPTAGQPGTGYAPDTGTGYTPDAYGNTTQPLSGASSVSAGTTDEPREHNASVGDLIGQVSRDMSTLMRQELELAKAELKQEANEATTIAKEEVNKATAIAKEEANKATTIAKEEATKAGKGAGMLGGAAFAGVMLVLFLSLAAMWGLAYLFDNLAWATLVVAVVWGLIAAVLAAMGRKKLKQVDPKRLKQVDPKRLTQVDLSRFKTINPKPEQTVETLKQVPDAVKPH
ncbi:MULTISPECIES: phage holin family protein [unclassified Modestobacter]|uniref:phage holin family protein n=1 Tax=unclassified Modestobacter TaxID=2643866 RepID=UPI0022AA6140|nr:MULTISPECIES: phage holin family protein [unclassified Modestobacter]MCZ2824338.1 phage holin family protein [Modestobacter sp. VKM Ac-2981]MCZ2854134.1 phage holin family protein [Modestobacter sp. VKM Ac-2982]